MDDQQEYGSFLGQGMTLINWFPNLVESQVDFLANTFTSLVTPNLSNSSMQQPTTQPKATTTTSATSTGPSLDAASATQELVRRIGQGVLGAVYAGMILSLIMLVAVIMGVVLVNSFLEEPVVVTHKLYFDYTNVNPEALFLFNDGMIKNKGSVTSGVPVGHTFYVSVALLVPDSDYNRDIGVFQITAEVISTNGKTIARSSQPSMLRFQSHPIRLMRTFALGLPLLFGFTRETQEITVQMLNYKEDSHLRTGAIRITLMPRALTSYLPQLYEAEIIMHSKLPRVKELLYNWKWTFYVWTSAYIFTLLLLLLIFFFKPLVVFPMSRSSGVPSSTGVGATEREKKPEVGVPEKEFADKLRKLQQYRKKRKAELLSKSYTEDMDSVSASSYTVTKDEIVPDLDEEDIGDSESV